MSVCTNDDMIKIVIQIPHFLPAAQFPVSRQFIPLKAPVVLSLRGASCRRFLYTWGVFKDIISVGSIKKNYRWFKSGHCFAAARLNSLLKRCLKILILIFNGFSLLTVVKQYKYIKNQWIQAYTVFRIG